MDHAEFSEAAATERDSVSRRGPQSSDPRSSEESEHQPRYRGAGGLVESGLQAQDAERERFVQLADRLARSKDPAEQERLQGELARLTFGD
jgi:hypothetical protein